jgi:hypothetical protein
VLAVLYQLHDGRKQYTIPIIGLGHLVDFEQQTEVGPFADRFANQLHDFRRVAGQHAAAQHLAGADPGPARDGGILPQHIFFGKAIDQHIGGAALAARGPPVQRLQRGGRRIGWRRCGSAGAGASQAGGP